jgi:hypothetical protein
VYPSASYTNYRTVQPLYGVVNHTTADAIIPRRMRIAKH